MFYQNKTHNTLLVSIPSGVVIKIPPLGFLLGKWHKFEKSGLTKVKPEEVDLDKVVWYPKTVFEDISNPLDLYEKMSIIRRGGNLELTDYIGIVKASKSPIPEEKISTIKANLSELSYNELVEIAQSKNISIKKRLKKAELIKLIENG